MAVEERTVDDLVGDLRDLGVAPGDLVMVHASLRAVAPVRGGADAVLDALASTIGPAGTILMTLGARDDWAWVNDRPEPERRHLLIDAVPFDCLRSPADPEVGVLAEIFRTRRGSLVSDHPEGRFGASGRLAEALVSDVPWDDYYGPGSPLERFVRAGGRVLRLGAGIDTLTVLHYAEYLAPLPSKRRVRRYRKMIVDDVADVRIVESLDDSDGIVDHPGDDYFAVILCEYLAAGRAAAGTVGRARSELIEAEDVVDFAVAWMAANLGGVAGRPE